MRPIIAAHSGPFLYGKKPCYWIIVAEPGIATRLSKPPKAPFRPETNIGELLMSEELCGALSRGVRLVECSWKRGTLSGKKGDLRAMRSAIQ